MLLQSLSLRRHCAADAESETMREKKKISRNNAGRQMSTKTKCDVGSCLVVASAAAFAASLLRCCRMNGAPIFSLRLLACLPFLDAFLRFSRSAFVFLLLASCLLDVCVCVFFCYCFICNAIYIYYLEN